MPIYDFRCSKCNKEFERLVKSIDSSDTPVVVPCPECKADSSTFMGPRDLRFLFNYMEP